MYVVPFVSLTPLDRHGEALFSLDLRLVLELAVARHHRPVRKAAIRSSSGGWVMNKAQNSTATPARNAICRDLVGKVGLLHRSTQRLQGRNHVLTARQTCSAPVGTEFPLSAKPHDDDTGQNPDYDLGHDRRDPEGEAVPPLVFEDGSVPTDTSLPRKPSPLGGGLPLKWGTFGI